MPLTAFAPAIYNGAFSSRTAAKQLAIQFDPCEIDAGADVLEPIRNFGNDFHLPTYDK